MSIQIISQKFFDYFLTFKGYSPMTIKGYNAAIKNYCNVTGVKEIEGVTIDNVRHFFYQGRTVKKWTSSSFIAFHKALIVFFRYCVTEGYMKSNPIEEIEVPKLERKIPSKLTKQEAMQILELVDNFPYQSKFLRFRNYAIFATFIFTGIRRQELLNLKFTDVDVENLSIFIRQGKGKKDRIIPINFRLAESLQKYIEVRKKAWKTCPEFFTSYTHDIGFTEHGLKKLVDKINASTGFRFGVHKLRHTFATLMLEGGCDIFSLSKMMGHSDIKTTTVYLAASVQHLREQILKHPLN